ncbi:MAG: protein kinase [Gemmatimonadota bacterium]
MPTPSDDRWRQIETVFAAALAHPPSEREAIVDSACSGDAELSAEVHALLAAHDGNGKLDRLGAQVAPLAAALRVVPLEGRLVGRFRIESRIGGGGMGVVYRAHDEQLGRPIALKFLQAHLVSDAVATERFRLEARTVAALEHPNICTVHEIGQTDDGLLYLAMPLYEGETVQARIAREPLPVGQAVGIAVQVLRALAQAHGRGIIHRDVKPSNVLITADGLVKLLDFGIAKLLDVNLTGSIAGPVGTLAYMSPEQALGKPLDARTDLWSVGVMLYEMLTAQRPYVHGLAAAMTGASQQPLPESLRVLRPEVSAELDAVVVRALARRAEDRFQTAADFERVLLGLGLADTGLTGAQSTPPRTADPAAPPPGARWLRPVASVGALIGAALLFWVLSRPGASAPVVSSASAARSVAVLPVVDQSERRDQQYFADGLTEEVISTLSRVDGLKVASSTSSFAYRTRSKDIRAIGQELGVSYIVEGSLQRVGDQLRITARLVSVDDGMQIWAQPFRRTAGDAFALQQDIAEAIARALQVKLVVGRADSLDVRPDATAYDLYLKGRYAWATRTEASARLALRFFEQAIENDSLYAPAYVGVADANAALGFYDYLEPGKAFPRAEAAARRAIALDGRLAEPHSTLGYVHLYYHWDLKRGEAEFKRAIELNDDYAIGHQWYANLLMSDGRFDEAVREMRRAQQRDPVSPTAIAAEGWVHYYAGDYASAMQVFQRVFGFNPNYTLALNWAGLTLLEMDSLPQAIALHRRLLATADSSGLNIATLARSLAVAGQRLEALRLLDILVSRDAAKRYVPAYEVAKVYAAIERGDDALAWLEKARTQRSHSIVYLKVDPAWRWLRRDPRFSTLVDAVLPQ